MVSFGLFRFLLVCLNLCRQGPIKEVYSTSAPEDAEFMINHMKSSLAGLRPSIESFEEFNEKLQVQPLRGFLRNTQATRNDALVFFIMYK